MDHLAIARKLSFLNGADISRLEIILLSEALASPSLCLTIKSSLTPNSFKSSGGITVLRTLATLLTVLAKEFLLKVVWKKLSLILGRLVRAFSHGGVLASDWALDETKGQLDNFRRCSLPVCVNLWAISEPASTVDQVQGRQGQEVEQARQACSVESEGGVQEGVPFITERYTSSFAGMFTSMK